MVLLTAGPQTVPTTALPTIAPTVASTPISVKGGQPTFPPGCVNHWKYQNGSNVSGPYTGCITDGGDPFCMLPAYVAGGQQNVTWKYTDNLDDPDCLTNWNFYTPQGNIVKGGTGIPRTITWDSANDVTQRWCPLRTYVKGGPENKAWKKC
ncbi:hypothetical protein EB118_05390 [bacterium]|nr:hypothetical protein [bacterium]NDD83103.1 hypothetical protein [bacterium]NDG29518.1 hypothetical protein [bacterium]